jgi:hypothetical protein
VEKPLENIRELVPLTCRHAIPFQAERRGRIFCSQCIEKAVERENINFAIRYSTMTRMTVMINITTVGTPA